MQIFDYQGLLFIINEYLIGLGKDICFKFASIGRIYSVFQIANELRQPNKTKMVKYMREIILTLRL